MQNGVEISESGATLVARLSGEIDHHAAKSEREEIDAAIFKCRPELLVLDFSEVRFMDSSGIGLIIGRADLCESIGAKIKVAGLSVTQRKLVRLSGVEKLKNLVIE